MRLTDDVIQLSAAMAARLIGPHVRGADELVDFGCGDGSLLELLDARAKTGIEPNETSARRAVERGFRIVPRPEDVGSGSVDAVVSNHALEHTLQPYIELRAMHRMLRPGGRLVVCVPIDDWRAQRHHHAGDHDNHLFAWTPRLLHNLLAEAGFDVRDVRVVTYGLPGRFTAALHRLLPRPVFDVAAVAFAVLRRRRQMLAVADRPPDAGA